MPAKKGERVLSKYDGAALYACIQEKMNASQVMAHLNIGKTTLKQHLFRLMQERKEFLTLEGLETRTRASSPVFKKGKIVITYNMLGDILVEENQKFSLEKHDGGIFLKKL